MGRYLQPDPLIVDDGAASVKGLADYSDRNHIVSGQRRADSWYHGNSKGFCSRVAARRAEHLWLCEAEHDRLGQELRENVALAGADGRTKTDFMGAPDWGTAKIDPKMKADRVYSGSGVRCMREAFAAFIFCPRLCSPGPGLCIGTNTCVD